MDSGQQEKKCSCENSVNNNLLLTEIDHQKSTSELQLNCKEKRGSKLSIFNLKARVLTFNCKKGKKSPQTSSSSISSSFNAFKKSTKWGIKFNCMRKEVTPPPQSPPVLKIMSNTANEENRACCQCTCAAKNPEESSSSSTTTIKNEIVEIEENLPSTSAEAALEPPTAAAATIEEDSTNSLEINDKNEEEKEPAEAEAEEVVEAAAAAAAPAPNPEIPPVIIEQAEGVRGIYGTAFSENGTPSAFVITAPFTETAWLRMFHEDCDETARIARAREIEQGVEPPANCPPRRLQLVCPPDLNVESLRALFQIQVQLRSCPIDSIMGCHTQVGFIHCLVPDLQKVTNCSFYWGKIDRYEAERLLEGKPEGTFLLRDSAQEEFLFSVSFRKYGRSLHARIEQWNHRFSFDSHDPGVFTSDTVCGLIEHYKDPSSCMFFEPMLTWPLHRNFTFSLQHLARASIVNRLTYDNINHLQLPKTLKTYLKEYHYRQKVRVERFDDDVDWLEVQNIPL